MHECKMNINPRKNKSYKAKKGGWVVIAVQH